MAANASVAVARLGGDAHYWGRAGRRRTGRPDPGRTRRRRRRRRRGAPDRRVRLPSAAILVDRPRRAPRLRLQRSRTRSRPRLAAARPVARCRRRCLPTCDGPRAPRRARRGQRAHRRDQRVRRRCRAARRAHRSCAARRPRRLLGARTRARRPGLRRPGQGLAAIAGSRPRASSASRSGPKDSSGATEAGTPDAVAPRVDRGRHAGRRRCLARRLHPDAGAKARRRDGELALPTPRRRSNARGAGGRRGAPVATEVLALMGGL